MRKRFDSVCGWGGMHLDQMLWYGSGGLKPTAVRAFLAAVLFTGNKKLLPHYAVNRKPVSSAVARALQMTGFWARKKIPF